MKAQKRKPRAKAKPVLSTGEREARSKRAYSLSAIIMVLDLVVADLEDLSMQAFEERDYGGVAVLDDKIISPIQRIRLTTALFWEQLTEGFTEAQKRRAICKGIGLEFRKSKVVRKRPLR